MSMLFPVRCICARALLMILLPTRQMHGQWYIRDGESLIPTPEDAQNDTKVEAPFTSALSDIKDAAMKTLKRSVDITSISVPQYFNRSSTSYIKHAALNAERLFTRPWQAKPFFNAVRLANGLNFCKGSGPGPASCHIEDDPHVFIFADYHKEYLEFVIVDVEDEMYEIINSTRLENLGANRLGTTSDVSILISVGSNAHDLIFALGNKRLGKRYISEGNTKCIPGVHRS